MKTISIYAALLFSIFNINFSVAQTVVKKETIKVWSNCGMCKSTIEKAAKSAGAKSASWNEESKQLEITYTAKKTTPVKIQKAIAAAGYDTQELEASNNAYQKLHACCQYDRKKDAAAMKCCDHENCDKEKAACKEMVDCNDKACCSM